MWLNKGPNYRPRPCGGREGDQSVLSGTGGGCQGTPWQSIQQETKIRTFLITSLIIFWFYKVCTVYYYIHICIFFRSPNLNFLCHVYNCCSMLCPLFSFTPFLLLFPNILFFLQKCIFHSISRLWRQYY